MRISQRTRKWRTHTLPIYNNILEVSGMPSHKLSFKIGAPVMLLRNLDPSYGLCNGTCLIVRRFTMRVVEAEIITGKGARNVAFSRALNSFPITAICHLHLQGNNFLCGWLMAWLLTSLKGRPSFMLAFISQMTFFRMANFMLHFHVPRH